MGKVIAISNRKGGVGKSTTIIQISDLASNEYYGYGMKLLCIDFDHQGSFTSSMKVDKNTKGIYDLIINQLDTRIKINDHVDFICANKADRIVSELKGEPFAEMCFADALSDFKEEYDLILIDCPPEEDFMNNSAYGAADSIIVPMGADRFSIEGVAELSRKVEMIRKLNPNLYFEGLLLTRIDTRTKAYKNALESAFECAELLHTKVFKTSISNSTVADNAQVAYKSIMQYAPKSKLALEYKELMKELFEN